MHDILNQDDGEINYFTVNKLDNDNSKPENLWTLSTAVVDNWAEGRVEVSSEGDKEYQVRFNIIFIVSTNPIL